MFLASLDVRTAFDVAKPGGDWILTNMGVHGHGGDEGCEGDPCLLRELREWPTTCCGKLKRNGRPKCRTSGFGYEGMMSAVSAA